MPMSTITSLWAKEKLPIRNGMYLADGRSSSMRTNPDRPGGLELLEQFDLDEFLRADPDWLTSIDITRRVELPDGELCCGEGSYGSEGFFARADRQRNLIWVGYLENSNPFVDIALSGTVATFTSSSDTTVSLDIDDPLVADSGGAS